MTFVHFENKKIEPCNLSFFIFCINVKISGVSSEPSKISLKEVGVSFGPHVETTKLSDMSKPTVNRNYTSVLYRFRVIARFSLKVTNFKPPHQHGCTCRPRMG